MKNNLKIGIIGFSKHNGHAFSWASIFNGYNENLLKKTKYPNIFNYLKKSQMPQECIQDANINGVWSENLNEAKFLSKTCFIPKVYRSISKFCLENDAVIINLSYQKNFIKILSSVCKYNKPILLDYFHQPNNFDFKRIFSLEKYPGQIIIGSPLRYYFRLNLNSLERKRIGKINKILVQGFKNWTIYAPHLVDPVIFNFIKNIKIKKIKKEKKFDFELRKVSWSNGLETTFKVNLLGEGFIKFTIVGSKKSITFEADDIFSIFKTYLEFFVYICRKNIKNIKEKKYLDTVMKVIN